MKPLHFPSLWQVLALDVSVAVCVASVCIGLCASLAVDILGKARMTEPLFLLSDMRVAVAEQIALRGTAEGQGEDAPEPEPKRSGTRLQYAFDGSNLHTFGRLVGDTPFLLDFRPALDTAGGGWSVLWLCGHATPPAGWASPSPAAVEGLLPHQLPHVCRHPQP